MRTFVYVIGSMDDFESLEDLKNTYVNNGDTDRNMSAFPVELSEDCKVTGYDRPAEIATIIGRGEAMSNGWCLDDTISFTMEE